MAPSLIEAAREAALHEYDMELFRNEVERTKAHLRKHVPLWHKIFPWEIHITKRKKLWE